MAFSGCPCLSGEAYSECCGRLHRGEAIAPTAERLMRSRYSAFANGEVAYLLATWHPSTRPVTLELELDQRWLRLDIIHTARGRLFDVEGTVEFRARYRLVGSTGELHEVSRFVRETGTWFYLDAVSSWPAEPSSRHLSTER